jgi:hypothetical protein
VMTRQTGAEQPGPDAPIYENPPEGLEWVVDPNWQVTSEGRMCRRHGCLHTAVARLDRSHGYGATRRWWHYCEWHLYGREIRDGKVVWRRILPDEVPAS